MDHDGEVPLPPYAYVPGGPWPHPTRAAQGHSAGRVRRTTAAILADSWAGSAEYRRGIVLFNAGYYWEAHEEWEALWHAHGRRGATADVLRALIKLAAAGVKVREHQPHGIVTHARRASALFSSAAAERGRRQLGLDLLEAAEVARGIAELPPLVSDLPGDRVVRVFTFRIEPRPAGDPGPTFPRDGDPARPADQPGAAG